MGRTDLVVVENALKGSISVESHDCGRERETKWGWVGDEYTCIFARRITYNN